MPAQKRLTQVSGHLAGSKSSIAPTEGDYGRATILQKNPDDVHTQTPLS
jgi:acetyl-CoA acyltransferase 1